MLTYAGMGNAGNLTQDGKRLTQQGLEAISRQVVEQRERGVSDQGLAYAGTLEEAEALVRLARQGLRAEILAMTLENVIAGREDMGAAEKVLEAFKNSAAKDAGEEPGLTF